MVKRKSEEEKVNDQINKLKKLLSTIPANYSARVKEALRPLEINPPPATTVKPRIDPNNVAAVVLKHFHRNKITLQDNQKRLFVSENFVLELASAFKVKTEDIEEGRFKQAHPASFYAESKGKNGIFIVV
jgi:hypothetical protein